MERIQKYIDRFFKTKEKNLNYTLTTDDMIAFIEEIEEHGMSGIFNSIKRIFDYGYIKGYRACLIEKKNRK